MDPVLHARLISLAQAVQPAPPPSQPSLLDTIGSASVPVKIVLALLVIMSVACWYIIGFKFVQLRGAFIETQQFMKTFYETPKLNAVEALAPKLTRTPVAKIFIAGIDEVRRVRKLRETNPEDAPGMENVERALRRATSNEITALEGLLPFLATTGSTAPFIGLFGTVVGIMNSFQQLTGSKTQSTIERVGPGIAEALFTTAVGLVAAVPAVMAYNFFLRRIRVLSADIDAFGNDFLNIVRRHLLT